MGLQGEPKTGGSRLTDERAGAGAAGREGRGGLWGTQNWSGRYRDPPPLGVTCGAAVPTREDCGEQGVAEVGDGGKERMGGGRRTKNLLAGRVGKPTPGIRSRLGDPRTPT